MINFVIIGIAIFIGMYLKKYQNLPENSHRVINLWIIYIALPAIALLYIPKINLNKDLGLIIATPWLILLGNFIFLQLLRPFVRLDLKTQAALMLTVGFSNMSFLGFPITEAFYGKEGLQLAIFCDQSGFITVSSLGILIASYASQKEGKFNLKNLVKKIFNFPPTLAFIAAVTLPKYLNFTPITPILESLAATMVPMALFSIGLQIQFKERSSDTKVISYALLYKLLLAPCLILGVSYIWKAAPLYTQVSVIESAMAPMVVGTIIATEFGLRPKLCNTILSIGIPISFLSCYLWSLIL